ncbi:hypothetical protein [Granulicella tundricola]|uniref:Uncharacterized protein n=1 Tax=Granulicella tundricola (strain ATCC BAA-1859 / DSM 23138 / MP5ACTX9) TaxID=1198114 RepID=E8WXI2_GRATM|nr:hypothetical protein [Granulicella tundricola]ADW68598.1 hypothetical protein AciX9_1545 [Granulicella tundricola MP5ACTX9]
MTHLNDYLESNSVRTLLAIIAILVSIGLFWLNKKKKTLSYEILRNDRLFKLNLNLENRIQITVDGSPAEDIRLVIVDIQNTGNEPIKRDEFDMPLRFNFGNGAEIVAARVLSTKPADLGALIETGKTDVTLQPLLLNKGDGLSVEILVTGQSRPSPTLPVLSAYRK